MNCKNAHLDLVALIGIEIDLKLKIVVETKVTRKLRYVTF